MPETGGKSDNMVCPKCGAFQIRAEACNKCGVVVQKYMAAQEAQVADHPEPVTENAASSSGSGMRIFGIFAGMVVVGVLLKVVGPQLGFGEHEFQKELRETPFFQSLQLNDPRAFNSLKSMVEKGIEKGESAKSLTLKVQQYSGTLLKKHLPHASDEATIGFFNEMLDLLDRISRVSSKACYQLLFPQRGGNAAAMNHFTRQDYDNILNALVPVIETAAKDPQLLPDSEDAQTLLQAMGPGLAEEYGEDLLLFQQTSRLLPDEQGKVCDMSLSIYERALNLSPKKSSLLLRHMVSQG